MKQSDSPAREVGVVLVAHPQRHRALSSGLPAGELAMTCVADAGEALAELDSGRAVVALVDAQLQDDAIAVIAKLRAETERPCALVAESIHNDLVTLADRCDADALVPWPPDTWQLRCLAVQGAPPRGTPACGSELPPRVIGGSTAMGEVWRLMAMAAPSGSSVLIAGETGVGKEIIARALHRFSRRRAGPFVALNCAAVPENLLESELLGHERGAFTGAVSRRKGRFELADGGTLFLDEVGDLPLPLQVKLLRVLQERHFERVGGNDSVAVDVRVVAATHRDLPSEVARGRFREDLYYRLAVLTIQVPPLRDRKGDILELWEHFLQQGAAWQGRRPPHTSSSAERVLLSHAWPGNVRELQNAAQHALTVGRGETIMPSSLPVTITGGPRAAPEDLGLAGLTMREIERAAILETYAVAGTVKATAEMLGISERTIHYRLRRYRDEGPAPLSPSSAPPRSGHPSRRRVVLAEDDDDLRWALADYLQSEGYDVVAVPDGRALLEHLGAAMLLEKRDEPPDVIVSDIRMPGLNGMHLLEKVRERGWSVPVVLITAFGDDATRERAGRLGADLVDKPIDTTRLQHVIDRALSQHARSSAAGGPT